MNKQHSELIAALALHLAIVSTGIPSVAQTAEAATGRESLPSLLLRFEMDSPI
jgi:hypothetical protein